jgi:hypothetical protein
MPNNDLGPVPGNDPGDLANRWGQVVDRLGWPRTIALVVGSMLLALPLEAIKRLPHTVAMILDPAYFVGWIAVIVLYARWLLKPARD